MTVAPENFTLSEANVGGSNVAGEGHWHVYVDDVYSSFSATSSVSLSGLAAGSHTLRVELMNNDHTELQARVFDEITVTVQ